MNKGQQTSFINDLIHAAQISHARDVDAVASFSCSQADMEHLTTSIELLQAKEMRSQKRQRHPTARQQNSLANRQCRSAKTTTSQASAILQSEYNSCHQYNNASNKYKTYSTNYATSSVSTTPV